MWDDYPSQGQLKISSGNIVGATVPAELQPNHVFPVGEKSFPFARPQGGALRGTVNAIIIRTGASLTANFYVPPHVPPAPPFSPVFLADMQEIGSGDLAGGFQKHGVYWSQGRGAMMAGNHEQNVLGMHPVADASKWGYAEYQIPTGALWFTGRVGFASDGNTACKGSVDYHVVVDGYIAWDGKLDGDVEEFAPKKVNVPVGRMNKLRLEVNNGNRTATDHRELNWCDHFTWLEPQFTKEPR
jgi:hypothetical protein